MKLILLISCLVITVSAATGKDAHIFVGYNTYEWEDTNCVLYNYKGFFLPMINLAQTQSQSHWTWNELTTITVDDIGAVADEPTRSLPIGTVLNKLLKQVLEEGNLHGVIGVSHSAEGAYGSEIGNFPYFHTHFDSSKTLQLEEEGQIKSDLFTSTIRLGPSFKFISNSVLDLLYWLDQTSTNINLQVFHETSYGSEKIARIFEALTIEKHPQWKVYRSSYDYDAFSGATSDETYFFRKEISKSTFFDETCEETLNNVRAVIIIGSNGFIRQTAVALYKAVEAHPSRSFEDFMMIAIPSTLWPRPSYKAADVINIRSDLIQSSDDKIAKIAFRNMFVITDVFNETRYEELSSVVRDNFYNSHNSLSVDDWTENRPVPTWSGYTYDAMILLLKAINNDNLKPSQYYNYLIGKSWKADDLGGISTFSGDIEINKYGDREWKLNIHHFGKASNWVKVASYSYGQAFEESVARGAISFPGGIPRLMPKCGYEGCKGLSDAAITIIRIAVILLVSLIVILILAAIVYRYYKKEQDLKDLSWRIALSDLSEVIQKDHPGDEASTDSESGSSSSSSSEGTSKQSTSLKSIIVATGAHKMYINVHVFLKPLVGDLFVHVFQEIELMKELKYLKDLTSDYLVNILGMCYDPLSTHAWMILEDVTKGTLAQALENDDMDLDNTFKLSMIDDIAMGLSFIQNKTNIGSHGNLKTSNILVSENFTLKLSDFGECVFKSDMKKMYHHSEIEYNKRLLWRAPELVRQKHIKVCGTKPGDTYSFAIIVHEIINMHGPYNLNSLDSRENANTIILKVKDDTLETPFRPAFTERIVNKPLRKIANLCMKNWWFEEPAKRDSARKIVQRLKSLKPDRRSNFLDRAVKRMEKFGQTLIEKASEKAAELAAEMKKLNDVQVHFIPIQIVAAGIEAFVPEEMSEANVGLIELAGLTEAVAGGADISKIVDIETKMRSLQDALSHNHGFFFGEAAKTSQVWVLDRVVSTINPDPVAIIKVVEHIIKVMGRVIRAGDMETDGICMKAAIHSGTIRTFLTDADEEETRFSFEGVLDHADILVSLAQDNEIIVSPAAHKAIQMLSDTELVLDWGTKQHFETNKIHEAYRLKVSLEKEEVHENKTETVEDNLKTE